MFIFNFIKTLEASGTIKYGANIQYLHIMVRGEVLRQFVVLSAEVESASPETLMSINLGLGTYFFPIIEISKQKRAMRHRMREPRGF